MNCKFRFFAHRLFAVLTVLGFAGLAPVVQAQPIITEVFYNPPGSSESAFEWFEIYNPGPDAFDLSALKIGSGSIASPKQGALSNNAGELAVGSYAVISKTANLGGACRVAQNYIVEGDFGLYNSNAQVSLYAADQTVLVEDNALDIVKYRSAGFPAAVDGQAVALQDLGSDNYIGSNWSLVGTANCMLYATATTGSMYATPGRRNDWCNEDAGAPEATCLPPVYDAGPGDVGIEDVQGQDIPPVDAAVADAALRDSALRDGTPNILDAGPQNMPTITLSEPASDQNASSGIDIVYSASDPDGDAISVALFYDEDNSGNDGVLIVSGLDASGTYTWRPAHVPEGQYYIFGRAMDARGGLAYAYAAGQISVDAPQLDVPQLDILTPASAETADKDYTISFSTNAVPGTVSLYYDADNIEGEAKPIVGGLTVPDSSEHVVWQTEQIPEGTYYIYGRYETAVGQVSAFSVGTVVVQHGDPGCSCQQAFLAQKSWIAPFLLILSAVLRRGRAKVVS